MPWGPYSLPPTVTPTTLPLALGALAPGLVVLERAELIILPGPLQELCLLPGRPSPQSSQTFSARAQLACRFLRENFPTTLNLKQATSAPTQLLPFPSACFWFTDSSISWLPVRRCVCVSSTTQTHTLSGADHTWHCRNPGSRTQ